MRLHASIWERCCFYNSLFFSRVNYKLDDSSHSCSWAGVALGKNMDEADFYVGWKNSTGGIVLSRRVSNGHNMPTINYHQIAQVVDLDIPVPQWAALAFSFSRPIISDNQILEDSKFIYAGSEKDPANKNRYDSSFSRHSKAGLIDGFSYAQKDQPKEPKNSSVVQPPPTKDDATDGTISRASGTPNRACISGNVFCLYGTAQGSDVLFTIHSVGDG